MFNELVSEKRTMKIDYNKKKICLQLITTIDCFIISVFISLNSFESNFKTE